MEIKKSPKADLQNKRGLLLEIGLIVALCLVIAAFAYTPKEHRIEKVDLQTAIVEEEITEITRQDQKPPEAPRKVELKVITDLLQVVTNDTKITTEVDFAEFDENTEVIQQVEVANWVQQNVKFPQIALENGIQGRVVLSFVIEKDGRLTNIQVLQTPDRSLSEEAIRVLSKSPKWSPGKQRNQVVRVKYTLPVDFRVQN